MTHRLLCSLLCSALLVAHPARAQALPDPEPERQRESQRIEALRKGLEAAPSVRLRGAAAEPSPRLPDTESPCFAIHSIELTGQLPQFGDLDAELAGPDQNDPPQGRCLGAQGIQILIARIQNQLIALGFVTTRVEAQPQDLASGKLVLTVSPGRVAQIRYTDPTVPGPYIPASVPLADGDVLNLRNIEQALENFTRVPSAETDIQIVPGEQEGTSDIVISRPPPAGPCAGRCRSMTAAPDPPENTRQRPRFFMTIRCS